MLKIVISFLMFCTDCKYYLIIWLFKVNSDDEKTRLDQMNQIVCLLLGMKSEINLSFVYIWQLKLDQSALISECLSNSIPYHFQVSNSVENDGSMMKKKILSIRHIIGMCYWFGRLIWNFSETLYRCLTKKGGADENREPNIWKNFLSIKSTKCRLLLSITIKVILLVFCCVCVSPPVRFTWILPKSLSDCHV